MQNVTMQNVNKLNVTMQNVNKLNVTMQNLHKFVIIDTYSRSVLFFLLYFIKNI